MSTSFTTADELHRHYRGVKYRVYEVPRLAKQAVTDAVMPPAVRGRREHSDCEQGEGTELYLYAHQGNTILTWRDIVKHVGASNGYSSKDILGKSRPNPLVRARFAAYWLVKEITDMSYPRIGMLFKRDHSTVIYGAKEFERRLVHGEATIDPEMARSVFKARIQRMLKAIPRRNRLVKSRCERALRILANS
jgi:Bacterial dnaA protein helix-turn-helix